MYNIEETPVFDAVDVAILGDRNYEKLDLPVLCGFVVLGITKVTDSRTIKSIGNLWRQLPYEGQMRCHIPPYGLRLYCENTNILEASICWQCNNIWITLPNGGSGYQFDGESEPARKLFRLLRYLSGEYWKHNPGTKLSLDDYL